MLKIISNIIGFISNLASAIGSIFSFLGQKDKEMNSPEMVQNKKEQQEQNFKDKVNKDLQQNNIEELGKDISL